MNELGVFFFFCFFLCISSSFLHSSQSTKQVYEMNTAVLFIFIYFLLPLLYLCIYSIRVYCFVAEGTELASLFAGP